MELDGSTGSTTPSIFAECPEKSVKWRSNCYFFEHKNTAFIKAELFCNNLGGHLASVHDGFTNAFLAQYGILTFNNSTPNFWIGITDMINPGNWSWMDGSRYSFSEWRKNTNDKNVGEKCGTANVLDARWDIDECYNSNPFVCEVKEKNITIPISTTTTKRVGTTTTISSSTNSPIKNCSSKEWVYFQGYCYFLTPTQPSWKSAENFCTKNKSSNLVSIHSADELLFVQNLRPQLYKWIGLFSEGSLLEWKWSDSTSVNYTPWASGLPQNGNSTCVTAYDEFRNDFGCDGWNLYAVCKKLADL
uniref:C-type lectin domain-containing protein n=1 Tax=Panagrolaimus sp. ES5 TaxID=591445 RepID=A0AC34F9S2_9BILA